MQKWRTYLLEYILDRFSRRSIAICALLITTMEVPAALNWMIPLLLPWELYETSSKNGDKSAPYCLSHCKYISHSRWRGSCSKLPRKGSFGGPGGRGSSCISRDDRRNSRASNTKQKMPATRSAVSKAMKVVMRNKPHPSWLIHINATYRTVK